MTIANTSQNDRKSDGLGIIVRTIANHRRYSVSVRVRVLRTFGSSSHHSLQLRNGRVGGRMMTLNQPYYQDDAKWWPTAKAHAVLMGLACPIVMRKDEPKMAKVTIIVVQR